MNDLQQPTSLYDRRKRLALAALCLTVLLVAMNSTLATIALPFIRTDLRLSDDALQWVVNAYLIAFGGSLLLAGRLGDTFGCRTLLLLGLVVFSFASLSCGVARTAAELIVARSVQGSGAAIMYAVGLAQTSMLFTAPQERARAFGIYVFVSASGGSVGTLLGGVLINFLDWHWVFLANVPAGAAAVVLCGAALPRLASAHSNVPAQIAWIAAGVASLTLIPRALLRDKGLAVASVVAAFFSAAITGGNFTAALYMRLVLLLDPLQLGLAFLPATLGAALTSLAAAPALVLRFGARSTLVLGLLVIASGLGLLAYASDLVHAVPNALAGMLLIGIGSGLTYNPLFLSGLGTIAPVNVGTASGIINTSYAIGGALGLFVASNVCASRTADLLSSGSAMMVALHAGYERGFVSGIAFAVCGVLIGLRTSWRQQEPLPRTTERC